ncbi:NAD(+) diphosphatase [Ancylobacter sp. G4_0304]|uniref:NAD(+) diphosphatase n=1 Tax=Ancylobacter sp. G4_0304 TaxID=3114289 RepID=UPI0039C6DE7D
MATNRLGPWPHLGYAGFRLDRASERRAQTPEFLRAPAARACLIAGETVVLVRRGGALDAFFDLASAVSFGGRIGEACLLGFDGAVPHFVLPLHAASAGELTERSDLLLTDLRSIAVEGLVPPDQVGELACAKALLSWHARRTFCSNCGERLEVGEGGWRRECPNCAAQHFPRTDPVVIMLTVDGDNCLLGRSPRFKPGMWSCLAGFVEPGETFEDAARRETKEEAGVRTGAARYLASQPWPFPMSVMIGFHLEAASREIVVDDVELEGARWFSRAEVAAMMEGRHPEGLTVPPPMAIAHHLIRAFVEGRDPPAG